MIPESGMPFSEKIMLDKDLRRMTIHV